MSLDSLGILKLLTPRRGQRKMPACMRPCSASHSRTVTPKRCFPRAAFSAEGCPSYLLTVNDSFRTFLDDLYASKSFFLLVFIDFADDFGRCRKSAGKGEWWDGWDSNPGPKP